MSLTLRGVFLLRAAEIDWFLHGLRRFAPLAWEQFVGFLPESLRGDICDGYWTQLNHELPQIRAAAANSWATYEARNVMLRTNTGASAPGSSSSGPSSASASQSAVGLARLEVHYMRANRFVPDDALLRGVARIRHIPCAIVQGKYDLLCPPMTAVALHAAWPESTLQIVEDAGHSAFEPGIRTALVAVMDGRRTVSQ
jgi:proline iminopeptidase